MKKLAIAVAGILTSGLAQADSLEGVDEMVCAAAQVQICWENDTCYSATPAELGVPDFVVIDIGKKTISTTKASNENRSTSFTSVGKSDGLIYLQALESGRQFRFHRRSFRHAHRRRRALWPDLSQRGGSTLRVAPARSHDSHGDAGPDQNLRRRLCRFRALWLPATRQ